MERLGTAMAKYRTMTLTKQEQEIYARHISLDEIGEEGQKKLKAAKVLVVGAGGLGCPTLQYLTAAGVGTIGIIDPDVIAISNLQRQVLYTYEDIGKPKAQIAACRLKKNNPNIQFSQYIEPLTSTNALSLFGDYDIIVDGSDNFATRYLVNDAAVLTCKPVVFGSIFKFTGQVSVYNFESGPTYRCLYPNPPKVDNIPNCSEIGVLGMLPAVIGSLQANEVIKLICGIGELLTGKLLLFDALKTSFSCIKYRATEERHIQELKNQYDINCEVLVKEITLQELNENKDQYNLLDVRTLKERNNHHIGGLHIPIDKIEARFHEIPTERDVVVYCQSGKRSVLAINRLEKLLNIELLNLKGGLNG